MTFTTIEPEFRHLSEEYLLVAAWKKAENYIRMHNWYCDVLDLDLTNASLDSVIQGLGDEVRAGEPLLSDPSRLVLAPKSYPWNLNDGRWQPNGSNDAQLRLRPLAHLSVRDQILSTALMILVADEVETRQGDPRLQFSSANAAGMVSYGHRLFCDSHDERLRYRWGSSSVYRKYFQDYQAFIQRPLSIVGQIFDDDDTSWAILSADLSQFYDRVRPELLRSKLSQLFPAGTDSDLIETYSSFFNWHWHDDDREEALAYASDAAPSIPDYNSVALPQGLVSSGFFANAVLIDFDEAIVGTFNEQQLNLSFRIVDYCRYVDDLRFMVRVDAPLASQPPKEQEQLLTDQLNSFLHRKLSLTAPGLVVNREKTDVLLGVNAGGGSPRYSVAMERINRNTSGVIDMLRGDETLDLIEGLFYSTHGNPIEDPTGRFRGTGLDSQPDVRENTVSRFTANRFRKIYRTMRPMAEPEPIHVAAIPDLFDTEETDNELWTGNTQETTASDRSSLDSKAEHFSLVLVGRWIRDPSNMRILRVALDMNPSLENLEIVLDLLQDHLEDETGHERKVSLYCLGELLKSGATETGLVSDPDQLPDSVNLTEYQDRLAALADSILADAVRYPWYVTHQAHLFLACHRGAGDTTFETTLDPSHRHYRYLRQVCRGDYSNLPSTEVVAFACIHAGLRHPETAAVAFLQRFRQEADDRCRQWLRRILEEQQPLAKEIWSMLAESERAQFRSLYSDHGLLTDWPTMDQDGKIKNEQTHSLMEIARCPANPFRHEYALLWLAKGIVQRLDDSDVAIPPHRVLLESAQWERMSMENFPIVGGVFTVQLRGQPSDDQRFNVPTWVQPSSRWAYQLGMLLRVTLTGQPDYTQRVWSSPPVSRILYRPYRSSWLRRRYGMFNGRSAFGPAWIPITNWIGDLLTTLLKWPGFPRYRSSIPSPTSRSSLVEAIDTRIVELERLYGRSSQCGILPIPIPKVISRSTAHWGVEYWNQTHTMRVGIAQTVLPKQADLKVDLRLNKPEIRRRQRRHTSAVLAAVEKMLKVRATHVQDHLGLELLVLPELSIHTDDIDSLILPFVRKNNCMVCGGLTFFDLEGDNSPTVNMAAWFIPRRQDTGGTQIEIIFQGKEHMIEWEVKNGVSSFRPAQWLIQIVDPWWKSKLWSMSCAVCYDATDLSLAADLKDHSDMFVIPALNRDVGTFDNMVAALHYHMFQHVVVSNSGEFGGSTVHAPFSKRHERTIMHTHGGDQVAIGFCELNFDLYKNGRGDLKTPPANLNR